MGEPKALRPPGLEVAPAPAHLLDVLTQKSISKCRSSHSRTESTATSPIRWSRSMVTSVTRIVTRVTYPRSTSPVQSGDKTLQMALSDPLVGGHTIPLVFVKVEAGVAKVLHLRRKLVTNNCHSRRARLPKLAAAFVTPLAPLLIRIRVWPGAP
jgi:hypothetical protein